MHPASTFHPQLSKFADHALLLGLSQDEKPSSPGFTAIVSETPKVERFRSRQTSPETPFFGKLAELQEPGLIFMESQAELTQLGGEISLQGPGILFILEADHKVITVSHKDNAASGLRLPPLLDPEIKAIVQEDIGQQRTYTRSLGSPFYRLPPLPALQNAGPEPLPYQTEHSGTSYSVGHHPQQPLVVNRVEPADVGIEHPVHIATHDRRS